MGATWASPATSAASVSPSSSRRSTGSRRGSRREGQASTHKVGKSRPRLTFAADAVAGKVHTRPTLTADATVGKARPQLRFAGDAKAGNPRAEKVGVVSTRGILKRPGSEPAREAPQKAAPRRSLLLCGRRCRPGKQVSWNASVRVVEFKRTLGDQNAVPQDGSAIPLALGRRVRTSVARLASHKQGDREHFEDRCYVPARRRCRLIRKDMGSKRFAGAWVQCKREVRMTLRSRRVAKQDPQTQCFKFMPTSQAEARRRALALARELRLSKARQSLTKASQRPSSGAARARAARRAATKAAELELELQPCMVKRRPLVELALNGGA